MLQEARTRRVKGFRWILPDETPNDDEKRWMFCIAIEEMICVVMKSHDHMTLHLTERSIDKGQEGLLG